MRPPPHLVIGQVRKEYRFVTLVSCALLIDDALDSAPAPAASGAVFPTDAKNLQKLDQVRPVWEMLNHSLRDENIKYVTKCGTDHTHPAACVRCDYHQIQLIMPSAW